MAISVSYYSGSYTYTAAKIQNKTGNNSSITPVGFTFYGSSYNKNLGSAYNLNMYTKGSELRMLAAYYDRSNTPRITTVTCLIFYAGAGIHMNIRDDIHVYSNSNVYLYDTLGGEFSGTNTASSGRTLYMNYTFNNLRVDMSPYYVSYMYNRSNGGTEKTLGNGLKYTFPYTNSPSYSYPYTTPASASISVTGLTASGTTVSISSSYSGRVLVSTDGTNYYYSSGTSLPVSLGTSSRTVYVAILSTSGIALGLSNGSSYSRSTLDSKISTYNTNETKNTNANNAASSFDSLYNSISGDITTVTSSNLSSLQSYLSTIATSSTSDSRYTTRKTKYDTLKRDYDAYQIRTSNLSQIRTNITEINTSINNTKNTVLPEIVTGYSNTYNTGRDVYNTVLEKLNTLKNK